MKKNNYNLSYHKGLERKLVTLFCTSLRGLPDYDGVLEIDTDSQNRQFKSPYDFRIIDKDYSFVCEAKVNRGKLSDFQDLKRIMYKNKNVPYVVLRFFHTSKTDREINKITYEINYCKNEMNIEKQVTKFEPDELKEFFRISASLLLKDIKQIKKEVKK